MSAKILALDTATEACSAALLQGEQIIERYEVAPRRHTQLILPMVDELLAEAGLSLGELDALAFGRGPGSFTGLRIAAGVIQGLALGADLPVVPVSDLAALALQARQTLGWEQCLVCQDARLEEFFLGAYRMEGGEPHALMPEALVTGDELVARTAGFDRAIGSGWTTPGGQQARPAGMDVQAQIHLPRAADIARLAGFGLARGEAVPAERALPVYLRDQVAKKPGQ